MERNKKKMVETLIKGRNSAKRLQNLLRRKVNDDELVSVDDLVTEISESFSGGLLVLSSFNSGDLCKVPVSPHLPEVYTPALAVKKEQRRGCYKRRKTIDSRTEISDTIEDCYAWRKYGQKEILGCKFPRCYFRCTHKHVHGCKALKQVQKMEDESNKFHITFIGHHTCFSTPNSLSYPKVVLDCKDSKNQYNLLSSPSTITSIYFNPSPKQEDLCDNALSANDAQSSSHSLVWNDILINDFDYFKNDGILGDLSFDDVFMS